MKHTFVPWRNSAFVPVFAVIVTAVTIGAVTRSKTNGVQPRTADTVQAAAGPAPAARPERNPDRDAYFGETHQHTSWSFDAYIFGIMSQGRQIRTNIGRAKR
jgi:hypothetical protein